MTIDRKALHAEMTAWRQDLHGERKRKAFVRRDAPDAGIRWTKALCSRKMQFSEAQGSDN